MCATILEIFTYTAVLSLLLTFFCMHTLLHLQVDKAEAAAAAAAATLQELAAGEQQLQQQEQQLSRELQVGSGKEQSMKKKVCT
jgi:hypothetical protein